ncbi:MAG TPA: DUF3175 domain-containing protein [Candidatus Didemnitutus sp.]|nr:DUF3175 domain-containing protein [Candidatus Didemnitutus sp.]
MKTSINSKVRTSTSRRGSRWSDRVTHTSNALDLEQGVFRGSDPARIARSLMRSANASNRRKSSPYRSAMSMLTFYENRAGKHLPESRRKILERAKAILREKHDPTR